MKFTIGETDRLVSVQQVSEDDEREHPWVLWMPKDLGFTREDAEALVASRMAREPKPQLRYEVNEAPGSDGFWGVYDDLCHKPTPYRCVNRKAGVQLARLLNDAEAKK